MCVIDGVRIVHRWMTTTIMCATNTLMTQSYALIAYAFDVFDEHENDDVVC